MIREFFRSRGDLPLSTDDAHRASTEATATRPCRERRLQQEGGHRRGFPFQLQLLLPAPSEERLDQPVRTRVDQRCPALGGPCSRAAVLTGVAESGVLDSPPRADRAVRPDEVGEQDGDHPLLFVHLPTPAHIGAARRYSPR
jgi:hypothetical protein